MQWKAGKDYKEEESMINVKEKKGGGENKIAGLSKNMSMMILKVNGLKTPFKGERLPPGENKHKIQPYPGCVQEAPSIATQNVEKKGCA